MSGDRKFPALVALEVARTLEAVLGPVCERVQIAGSLRRQKAEVGDIEILYIPKMVDSREDLLSPTLVSAVDLMLDGWVKSGLLTKRPSKVGTYAWGEKNKLAIHQPSGIPVDFFATTQLNWWNSLVCRTGGKDNNLLITHTALSRGWSFEAYGAGFHKVKDHAERHDTTSERDVFEFLGLRYLEPKFRK